MYHISDDVRAQKSAKRICDVLIDYSKKKPFSDISVSDLNREYLISRTTFYRLFDNTVDVLEYMAGQMAQEILLHLEGSTLKEQVIYAISQLQSRKDIVLLLFNSGHFDLFQKKGAEYIPQSNLTIDGDVDFLYFNTILSYVISLTAELWVSEGMKDSPEKVYDKIGQSIALLGKWFS